MDHEEVRQRETVALGDADLVLRTRSGDAGAFGELWRRHYRAGVTVARNMTSSLDADDLVQEAYTRIYQSIVAGGGPTGSFRAYLFTSIRNTAAAWGRARRETAYDELDHIEDPAARDDSDAALDRSLTHQAFRSLPTRWQEVLWYSEIEQMKPAEIAPLLGLKPTAVAQLTFRAREGLREAWVQAHLRAVADGSDCQWTIERLGAYARRNLGRRDRGKVERHLVSCVRCGIVASEAEEVSGRLALILLPLALGATGTAGYLATVQGGGAPILALAAMPSSVMPGAVVAPAGATSAVAGASAASAGSAAVTGAGVAGGAAGTTAIAAGAASASALASIGATTGIAAAGLVVVSGVVAAAVGLPALVPPADTSDKTTVSDTVPAGDDPVGGADGIGESTDTTQISDESGPGPADIPVLPEAPVDDSATDGAAGDAGPGTSANGNPAPGAGTPANPATGTPASPATGNGGATGNGTPSLGSGNGGTTGNGGETGSGTPPQGTGAGNGGSTGPGTGAGKGNVPEGQGDSPSTAAAPMARVPTTQGTSRAPAGVTSAPAAPPSAVAPDAPVTAPTETEAVTGTPAP
ncbi:sigma-70 family RNA polymerase sigma factor [Microbacterium sp. CFH 90308]|uniref:Sigma-70 family RNA polymerase sigma factor n=1 Tax=Microbacterium salsuginis TaxID=2722803 RepID=A0ABX1KCF1_9MICO|nr:sigma-70 family RNA polymerase sigma factor [Microbacterium sp. CFH 90308]NLP84055.1 sigma-70 family RNA polymerase sigma factor [Microbacterium sp. CFH 90308]